MFAPLRRGLEDFSAHGRCRCVMGGLLAAGLVALAADRAPAVTFTNVTTAAGINHLHALPATVSQLGGGAFYSGGAAAGDFDGDGLIDLIFTRLGDTEILYRNQGDGTFEARTAAAGFAAVTNTNGLGAADVDNDGDLDLYATTAKGTRNYLYLNDGLGVFTAAATAEPASLANGVSRYGQGVAFGDYDLDGYLDLAVGDWGNVVANSQSRLFRNLGAAQPGSFQDVTGAPGVSNERKDWTFRFAPRFVDLDRDGRPELTFASDFETSQLYWNDGDGTFTDGTAAAGVGTDPNGMGSTFGDYDLDGDLDWFITATHNAPGIPGPHGGGNRLYRNNGDRTFADVTMAAGVIDARWGWGTNFLDFDNDGDLDLMATNGFNGNGWVNDQTFLWRNDGGVFTDVSTASGIVDTQQGRGLVQFDFDNDGDLDVVVVNNAAAPILYRNDGGNANHFLRLDLEGTDSNRDGIGAWITVTPDLSDPARTMIWEVESGSSFLSQNERTAHFGLGADGGAVDLVTIQWPSGLVQTLLNVPADQTLLVVETDQSMSADFDHNLHVEQADLAMWGAAFATTLAGDADGNGESDGADLLLWQRQLGLGAAAAPAAIATPEPDLPIISGAICLASIASTRRRTLAPIRGLLPVSSDIAPAGKFA